MWSMGATPDRMSEQWKRGRIKRKVKLRETHVGRKPMFLSALLTALFILHKTPTSHSIYRYILNQLHNRSEVAQRQRFQKIASTIPLPIAEPLQGQCQSVSIYIDAYGSTDLLQNLRRQQRMSRAVWMNINNKSGSVPDLRHVPPG